MKIVFIAWIRYFRRSDLLAQHLGATMHFIHFGQRGKAIQAPVRYLVQALRTWSVLCQEQPDVILAQVPPIFCALVAFLYARLHRVDYVIDTHSSTFISSRWRWALGLHRKLSRWALTTIVHNADLQRIVSGWGCQVSRLGFTPGDYPAGEHFPLGGRYNLAVVGSFDPDEPLDIVLEAASRLPDVNFYVTGDSTRLSPSRLKSKPANCHFTGYLPYERYIGLLRGVDAIVDLTTWDHTVLMGAYEAVSLGIPLITSDWPVLRRDFPIGTVHIPNTVEGVCNGVRRTQCEQTALQQDILRLRERLDAEWNREIEELWSLLRRSGSTRMASTSVSRMDGSGDGLRFI